MRYKNLEEFIEKAVMNADESDELFGYAEERAAQ